MADSLADGNTRVAFVPTIANIASPTTTELNAVGSVMLQWIITADGLMGYEATTAEVPTNALASTFNTKTIGRDDFSGTGLRLKKQTTGDTAYSTLVRGTSGYIVIRRDVPESTAWASSQAVEVYPITCGQSKFLPPEENSVRKYEVPTPITTAPNLRATIA